MKRVKGFFICLIIIALLLTGCSESSLESFSVDNTYNHIVELTLDKYNGRLPGTKGNKLAAEYIAKEFRKIGIKPYMDNDNYLQEFEIISPILSSPVTFQILDNENNTIKEYEHRKDFSESTSNYSGGGNIKGEFQIINSLHEITKETSEIILYFGSTNEIEEQKFIVNNGVKAIIRTSENLNNESGNLKKTLVVGEKSRTDEQFINLVVINKVMEELIEYSKLGYKANIELNLAFPEVHAANVIGYIPGTDEKLKDETLLVTAHFDHVGTDPNGQIFRGALDNASGTAMILELARAIQEKEVKPKRTIAFVAFNGEESGLQGSKYYVLSRPFSLTGTRVINIDMIGASKKVDLQIDTANLTSIDNLKNHKFTDSLSERAWDNKIQHNVNRNSYNSDHYSFIEKGIPAVTITHPSDELIHTYGDYITNIDKDKLGEVGNLILDYIDYYGIKAKDSNSKLLTEEQIEIFKIIPLYLLFLILIILLSIYIVRLTKKNERLQKVFKNRPVYSTVLILFIITSILVYNSGYKLQEVSSIGFKSESWESTVDIKAKNIQDIYDIEDNEVVKVLISGEKDLKEITVSKSGKVLEETTFKELNREGTKYEYSNNDIYYIYNNILYKFDKEDKTSQNIMSKVDGFLAVDSEESSYLIVYNDEKITIRGQDEIVVNNPNINGMVAQVDNKERLHLIFKEVAMNNKITVKYMMLNNESRFTEPQKLYTLKEDSDLDFGMDKAKGYIFYKEDKDYYYISFNVGNRTNRSLVKGRIELHESSGGLLTVQGFPQVHDVKNDSNIVKASVVAKNNKGKNYIYNLDFSNGKLNNRTLIYKTEKSNIHELIVNSKDVTYVGWIEGDSNSKLKMKSSDSGFGANTFKNELFFRFSNIIQNIIFALMVMLSRIYWLIPGVIIILIYKQTTKYSSIDKKPVICLAIVLNLVLQILTFNMPRLTGIRFESLIITLIIAGISAIAMMLYKYEKARISIIKLFVIFTILNMIFIALLYAPYTLEGRLDRLRQTEMFQIDEGY